MCSTDSDGQAEFATRTFQRSFPRTRRHRCEECGCDIKRGERHARVSGKYEGDLFTYRLCLDCDSWSDAFLREHFKAAGESCHPEIGTLWQSIAEFTSEYLGYDPEPCEDGIDETGGDQ